MRNAIKMPGALIWLILLVLMPLAVYFSIASSFRVDLSTINLAIRANIDRALCASAAGMALAVAGAVLDSERSVFKHVSIYSALVLGALTYLLIIAIDWPMIVALLSSIVIFRVTFVASKKLDVITPLANFVLAAALGLIFVLSIVCYGFASALENEGGGVILWLMGSINLTSHYAWPVFLLAITILLVIVIGWQRHTFAALLAGLGIGIAGVLVFVAWLAPYLAKQLASSQRAYLLVSAWIGASMLIIADSVSRLLLGGYAPALLIPVSAAAIPVVLWFNRQRLSQTLSTSLRSYVEAVLIVLGIVVAMVIIVHASDFARSLT